MKDFIFYMGEYAEIFDELDDWQVGRLMRGVINHRRSGEYLDKESNKDIYISFLFIKARMETDDKNRISKKEKFREYGRKGGRPRRQPKNDSDNDIKAKEETKPKEVVKIKRDKRFIPPAVEEVKAYCSERKNSVDTEAFIDFYSSKNWMIGKNKMKDWKAAVRTWERNRDNGNNNSNNINGTKVKSMSTAFSVPTEYNEF